MEDEKTMEHFKYQSKLKINSNKMINDRVNRIRKADTSMKFMFDILLPDFLIFVVGITAGISLMLFLFQS